MANWKDQPVPLIVPTRARLLTRPEPA